MSDRLPWFRCNPSALLGAMAGLLPDESLIYITVLMRIYETGGPIADSARTLARRTGITERRAASAIEGLSMARKITVLSDDRIDSHSTHPELEWQRESRRDKSSAGKASAEARGRRAKIDRAAEADETIVKFPDQKTLKKQRNEATAVRRALNKEEEDTYQEIPPLARKTPINPYWEPDAQDIEVAHGLGVLDRDLAREARVFRDRCLESDHRSADWRASWRKFLSYYRPSDPSPQRRLGKSSREAPVSAHAANLVRLAEKLSSAPPTGDLSNVTGPDPDEIIDLDDGGGDEPRPGALLLEFAGDRPGDDEPGEPAGPPGEADPTPTRGESRGVPWTSGGGSGPSDQVLAAAGFGGNDHRSARALRRARPPRG